MFCLGLCLRRKAGGIVLLGECWSPDLLVHGLCDRESPFPPTPDVPSCGTRKESKNSEASRCQKRDLASCVYLVLVCLASGARKLSRKQNELDRVEFIFQLHREGCAGREEWNCWPGGGGAVEVARNCKERRHSEWLMRVSPMASQPTRLWEVVGGLLSGPGERRVEKGGRGEEEICWKADWRRGWRLDKDREDNLEGDEVLPCAV